MFMLISNSTKYSDIMSFMNIKEFWSDHLDNINRVKRKYKFFEIDTNGNILIALKLNNEIIINENQLSMYKFDKQEYKRNFIIKIRKLKLNSIWT